MMPKMDGISFVKALRKNGSTPNTPVIMITSNGKLEDVMQGVKSGVNDYIVKPFEPKTLQHKIISLLSESS